MLNIHPHTHPHTHTHTQSFDSPIKKNLTHLFKLVSVSIRFWLNYYHYAGLSLDDISFKTRVIVKLINFLKELFQSVKLIFLLKAKKKKKYTSVSLLF